MTARIWGAHAARVQAMTSPSSRTFSSSLGPIAFFCRKIVSARPPKPAREAACAPQITAAVQVNLTR
jgi:hypothetical protein